MSMSESVFGQINGEDVPLYSLKNATGFQVDVCPFGACVVNIFTPDRDGLLANVNLGYDTLEAYLNDSAYMGAVVGRFANRIEGARFELAGNAYQLNRNAGSSHLHGGDFGFNKKLWTVLEVNDNSLSLQVVSADGDENYPGELTLSITYSLSDENRLCLDYRATTDKKTVLNPTSHCYFNLSNEPNTILNHEFQIFANQFLPMNENWVSRGCIGTFSAEGRQGESELDFRQPKRFDVLVHSNDDQVVFAGGGADHNYIVDQKSSYKNCRGEYLAGKVYEPKSGRCLQVWTDQPGVQFYSGNMLQGDIVGKGGVNYPKYAGFCLETQHFPNSPNVSGFPSTELDVGEEFQSRTSYQFFTD